MEQGFTFTEHLLYISFFIMVCGKSLPRTHTGVKMRVKLKDMIRIKDLRQQYIVLFLHFPTSTARNKSSDVGWLMLWNNICNGSKVFFLPHNVFFLMNQVGSLTLYVLCSAMYGSLTGIWCSPDLAPASALFAGARVALCVFVALVWVFKASWWKQKRESPLF